MTIGQKRPIRQRVWASDEAASARAVGENFRDVAGFLQSLPKMRPVTIEGQVYSPAGIVFSSATRPLGIVNVYSETVDGTVSTSPLSGMSFDKGVVTAKFSALVPGVRYATIRLLVIG